LDKISLYYYDYDNEEPFATKKMKHGAWGGEGGRRGG
jgi:hypothetical protein